LSPIARRRPRGSRERLVALLGALRGALRLGVLLGRLEVALGLLETIAQVARVEVARVDRLLDEHEDALGRHLQVALALGEADDIGLRLVQPQLGRVEAARSG